VYKIYKNAPVLNVTTSSKSCDDTDGKRTAANSRTSFASLSPGEKDSRMANLARERKFHCLTSTRLREGLNSSAKFKHINCASGFREIITRAFDTLAKLDTEEKSAAKQHLIKQLVGFSVGSDAAKINEEEAVEFAAYLMTEIDNKGKQLAGEPNQVDFTPALLQSAIVLYLRTKVGYKDQRALSPLAMPSPSTMNRLLRDTRLKEGYSPKNYGNFFDECADLDAIIIGHLLFYEMKLKTGVFWQTSDHTVCGFASSSPNSTIKSVLSDMVQNGDDGVPEEFHDVKAPAVYVNQWRFRLSKNVVHNSNFFFNCGSLDGNELLSQMIHVVCGYEKIGIKIFGLLYDAGGSNRGLFKLLRDGVMHVLTGTEQIPSDYLTFVNPYDPSRRIAFFNCSTHNLKISETLLKIATFRTERASLSLREPSLGGSMWKLSTTGTVLEKKQARCGRLASNFLPSILTIGNSWTPAWQSPRCIRMPFLNKRCMLLMVSESGTSFWIRST
jgi:hypothetical protein